ncbi:hypothetical protein SAMN05421752_106131 [Natronorubrum thiooxidans]|uniref:Uncharacterized protein n=1 Tax=Natronorubrum thiooxidans TaxID=308853 RepID=A0A1N7FAC1_9EURY|nr:hypothetical protein SAMN05421752_106131 [Natronorubrum thiooxidans]
MYSTITPLLYENSFGGLYSYIVRDESAAVAVDDLDDVPR